jgi:hypothetical protein
MIHLSDCIFTCLKCGKEFVGFGADKSKNICPICNFHNTSKVTLEQLFESYSNLIVYRNWVADEYYYRFVMKYNTLVLSNFGEIPFVNKNFVYCSDCDVVYPIFEYALCDYLCPKCGGKKMPVIASAEDLFKEIYNDFDRYIKWGNEYDLNNLYRETTVLRRILEYIDSHPVVVRYDKK